MWKFVIGAALLVCLGMSGRFVDGLECYDCEVSGTTTDSDNHGINCEEGKKGGCTSCFKTETILNDATYYEEGEKKSIVTIVKSCSSLDNEYESYYLWKDECRADKTVDGGSSAVCYCGGELCNSSTRLGGGWSLHLAGVALSLLALLLKS